MEKKKGRGRPALNEDQKRVLVAFTLPPKLANKIKKLGDRKSTWLESFLNKHLKKKD